MPRYARNTRFTSHVGAQLYVHLNTASHSLLRILGSCFISTPASRFLGAFFTSISHLFTAAFRSLTAFFSDLARMHFMAYFNQMINSAYATLFAFLLLKYNHHNQSAFATHPAAMHLALATFALYCLAYALLLRFPLHPLSFLAHHLLLLSGYISLASLASVLLTDTAAALIYAVFGSVLAAELLLLVFRQLIQEENVAEYWGNVLGQLESFE